MDVFTYLYLKSNAGLANLTQWKYLEGADISRLNIAYGCFRGFLITILICIWHAWHALWIME